MRRLGCRLGFALVVTVWLAGLAPAYAGADAGSPVLRAGVATAVSRSALVQVQNLSALTQVGTQLYGAGKNVIAALDEKGQVTRSVPMGVTQVAGIAPFTGNRLLVGEAADNSVQTVDLSSGATAKLFSIRALNPGKTLAAGVLQLGHLASVAFDGKNVYAALRAGYSSSILKIDAGSGTVLAQAFAPGPNPTAMDFSNGQLLVLDGSGNKIRRYDANFRLDYETAVAAPPGGAGLIVRGGEARVLVPSQRSIQRLGNANALMVAPRATAITAVARLPIGVITAALARKVGVLICGDRAESGFDEFWNDTVWMYKMLRAKGFDAANIYVLYGDGSDYASANPTYQISPPITNFRADTANVTKIFRALSGAAPDPAIPALKTGDTLFIWTFDHGSSGGGHSYLCLRDGAMLDTTFASLVNPIPYKQRAIFMQQCFSGGFVDDLRNSKTFISTACSPSQVAWESNHFFEVVAGHTYHHGEYNYNIISALGSSTPVGGPINADSNGNSNVSCTEGHGWEVGHDTASETPQMDDSGGIGANYNFPRP